MKESSTLAGNAANNFLRREVLLNTKGQYMKESNTLAGNAGKNALKKGNLILNIKGKHMKESSTLAGNVTIKQHRKEILLSTKGQYIKE